ncbi:hypothetical protein PGQ11_002145 [Apiospora arundinis]|uniref:Uncharacterized protein n=1 Tax=Apiospora arundinis TaxID=335852 RepID=A0ABR2JHL6_9PEZI
MHRVSPGMEPQFRTAGKPVCAPQLPLRRGRGETLLGPMTNPFGDDPSLRSKPLATAQDGGQACRAPDNRAEEQDTNVRRVV